MAINFLNTVAVDENVLFVDTVNDRVGIGTDSPDVKLQISQGVDDTPTILRLENTDTTIDDTQEVNTIQFYSNDASAGGTGITSKISQIAENPGNLYGLAFSSYSVTTGLFEAMRINSSGNVGIGTNNPADKLHVSGGAIRLDNFYQLRWGGTGTGIYGHATQGLNFYTDTGSTRLKIEDGGNVGIGTTAPTSLLHVKNSTYGSALASFDTNGRPLTIGAQSTHVYMGYGNREQLKIAGTSGNGRIIIGTSLTDDGTNTLQVGGTGYFSGNVGIGTTNPDTKLHVEGNVLIDAYNQGEDNGLFFREGFLTIDQPSITVWDMSNSGASPDGLSINSNDGIRFRENGGEVARFKNGSFGIGTTSPVHKLTVNAPNDTTAVGIDFPSAHFDFSANSTSGYNALFHMDDVGMDIGHDSTARSLNLKTGNLDRVTIKGNGDVGIGTTSPETTLSVVGETSTNNLIGGSINLATPSGWVIPSGAMSARVGYYGGDFTLNGSITENGIEWGLGPFNDRQLLWTTTGSTDNNSDGGWNKTLTDLDIESPYLSVVYFKRVSSNASGSFYHGTGVNILNLDGTSNTNPYFTARALSGFDQGVWYASVGVIQSNSDSNTTAYQDISGLYRLDTGAKVGNANAYKFASTGATLSRGHRAYLYYSTDTSVVGHFANPGFYKIDGDQPKLHDIVSGDSDDVFWSANGNSIYNDNSGNVGIGTSSPGSKLDIVGSSLASQFKLSNTTADTTTKYGALVGRHYTNSEEPVTGMLITSSSSATGGTVSIGGGISAANAVNNIILYTAANNTTLTGTERMRVASNGNVGIGTTSPDYKLDVEGDISLVGGGENYAIMSPIQQGMQIAVGDPADTATPLVTFDGANQRVGIGTTSPGYPLEVNGEIAASGDGYLINGYGWANEGSGVLTLGDWDGSDFVTRIMDENSNEVLRVAGGKVGIGTTSPGSKLDIVGATDTSGVTSSLLRVRTTANPNAPEKVVGFYVNTNTERGFISVNQYQTAYSTSSDYRLKENIVPIPNGIERLKELKPCRFNFIQGDPNYVVDGFIAHEAAEVIPEAVTGEKDAVDEDNNPSYQGIDQSKIVPLLTSALQEAISKIEQLEARIQTLENN